MKGLQGKRIGVAADRSAESISTLIQKRAGTPEVFSLQGRKQLQEETSRQNINDFLGGSFDLVMLTTGIGARTLAESAEALGLHARYIETLKTSHLAIRGRKTHAWLKQHDIEPALMAEDGTMEDLLTSLEQDSQTSEARRVFLQAYNQDDALLKGSLEALGYSVYLSQPYTYDPPEPETIHGLTEAIKQRSLDGVVFTSKTQVRNLFQAQSDCTPLLQAFNDGVLAVAVGKVTAHELASWGIDKVLQPEDQKMGAMVVALDRYYQEVNV
ncbi:uroporphyrinogen-III synthase [Thalassobacillus sp. CUG 92003]|uniref:uroporphyrinogen-III synthase n=1 Tax=Thalassobacillus sp. CUG 92003 TaxID=2736641 RepID=UPI0015E69FE3|nr:uroporphyrinogen-III synthase [Thalassobacillus sp. CUG 92003]